MIIKVKDWLSYSSEERFWILESIANSQNKKRKDRRA